MEQRKRLVRKLRKAVRCSTRFDVEPGPEPKSEIHTCRKCGHKVTIKHPMVADELFERLTAYRAKGGIWGVCPGCSKRAALERYPE